MKLFSEGSEDFNDNAQSEHKEDEIMVGVSDHVQEAAKRALMKVDDQDTQEQVLPLEGCPGMFIVSGKEHQDMVYLDAYDYEGTKFYICQKK